jgi:hypothetical protein
MKAKILLLAVCLCLWSSSAQEAGRVNVVKLSVDCSSDDAVGQRYCFALKEKIRTSRGFAFVDLREAQHDAHGFAVHIISIDNSASPDERGWSSAMAVVFTLPTLDGTEIFQDAFVKVVGAHRVEEEASRLLAEIDHSTEFLQH